MPRQARDRSVDGSGRSGLGLEGPHPLILPEKNCTLSSANVRDVRALMASGSMSCLAVSECVHAASQRAERKCVATE